MKEYKVTLPSGKEHTLVFNPDSSIRYTIDGKRATGVTTILGAINKPALVDWSAKMAYQDVLDDIDSDPDLERVLENTQRKIKEKDYAHKKKSGAAMDVGTLAHADVEAYIRFKMGETDSFSINPETAHIVQPFIDWAEGKVPLKVKTHRYDKNSIEMSPKSVQFLLAEQSVFSPKFFYAGTFDFLAVIDGKKYICDFKTSTGIYGREYFYQTAAYRNALAELGMGDDLAGSVIIRSGKEGNDLEVKVSESYEQDFKAFKAAYVIYKEGFVDEDVSVDDSLTNPH